MKSMIVILLGLSGLFAHAQESRAIYCESVDSVNRRGGVDYKEVLKFTATLNEGSTLSGVQLTGFLSTTNKDLQIISEENNKFVNFNKYSVIVDAWCFFNPMLPKNILSLESQKNFSTYVEMKCESGSHQYIKMKCQKN